MGWATTGSPRVFCVCIKGRETNKKNKLGRKPRSRDYCKCVNLYCIPHGKGKAAPTFRRTYRVIRR